MRRRLLPRRLRRRGVGLVSEADERLPVGPRGAQGRQGERGERGLSRRVRWAIVGLFVLGAGVGAGNLLFTAHEVNANAGAQRQQRAAQRAQGELLEQKLCATLGRLSALRPPAGNAATNPARGYDQQLHATLAQLGPDLGCKGKP
jgi:hypothetical protein